MSKALHRLPRIERLGPDGLLGLLAGRRWFAAADLQPEAAYLAEVVHADEELELGLVDVVFTGGLRSTYLVALAADGGDALEDRSAVERLLRLARVATPCTSMRAMGVEQSNSSVLVDERFALKLYRRIETGPGVEAELLRALEQAGFASAPRLRGILEHASTTREATLAIVTEYVPSAGDGWELCLDALAAGDDGWLPARAGRLGEVTGAMHAALAAATDPAVAPEQPRADAIQELACSLAAELDVLESEEKALSEGSPLAGRFGGLQELVRDLAARTELPRLVLRSHGDYHLGQVLWADRGDWVVIDLEGEPGRSIPERRRRTFALRDVAGMLRSFAYAADASSLLRGVQAPEGWEPSCRAAFLDGWRSTVDPRLVPASDRATDRLLALCELQKLLYELRYELAHRPEWVGVPAAGLARILEAA